MSKSGGAPSASERKVCHLSRDAFFACLEQHNDRNSCLKEKAKFEENCPKSWVNYFCRRRDYKKYSERLGAEGYIPSDRDTY